MTLSAIKPRLTLALFALPSVIMPLSPARAQTIPLAQTPLTAPPPAAIPLNPNDLKVATQIVAIILPPEQRMAIVERVIQAMMTGLIKGDLSIALGVDDPGLQNILQKMLISLPNAMRPVLEQHLPELTDAMARAYVRHLSSEDLRAVLAFAQTPAGGRYLSHSTELMQDPEVLAALFMMNYDALDNRIAEAKSFKQEITAYLAQHPDVAKKLAQAQGVH